jgi:cytochrome c-type biogenesis protein CcmH
MWRWWILVVCFFSSPGWAVVETWEFENEVQRQRYYSFIDEMRCPKCQNQNLAGSDSPIAMDLRRELYLMIEDGRSDKEIVDFMVERYGDYILYRPRVTPVTYLLWFGPAILLLVGIIVLIVIVRQRRRAILAAGPRALDEHEQARLRELLQRDNNPVSSSTPPTERTPSP